MRYRRMMYPLYRFRIERVISMGAVILAALPMVAGAGESFRLLSYNIHHGEGMDKKLDLVRIADLIKAENPDVVALQEVDKNCVRSGKVDQPAEFAKLTGMTAHFQKAMDYDGGEYGICLLTKGKELEVKGFSLPNSAKPVEPRVGQAVKLKASGGTLTVANTHLEVSSSALRLAQVQFLMQALTKEENPGVVILAGDFNSQRGDAVMSAVTAADWEVPEKMGNPNTIPSGKPAREIDFAVLRPKGSLKVVDYRVPEEAVASDHRPILIELKWPAP